MDENPIVENVIRFGVFEADLVSGELRKRGVRVRLGGQPFQVLARLLGSPGRVVTREELKQELWADDTFVDFENGVNTAIRRIRRALDDSGDTPRYIETLPRRGYRFIGQIEGRTVNQMVVVQSVASDGQLLSVPCPPPPRPNTKQRRYLPGLLLAVTGIVSVVLSPYYFREPPPEVPARKFAITPPVAIQVTNMPSMVAISPDAMHIAFAEGTADGKLWVRRLDGLEPRAIPHSEGARGRFWSPGSESIGFATTREIKRVSVHGGQVSRLCELPGAEPFNYSGGSWSPDGEIIVFGSADVIYEVPALGGAAAPLIKAESQKFSPEGLWGRLHGPHFLPSETGRRIVAFAYGASGPKRNMVVQDLDSVEQVQLGPGVRPYYSPTGHLLHQSHMNSRDVMALPFSPESLTTTGESFPIAHDGHHPSIAADGTLVYLERPVVEQKQLVWIDRCGNKVGEISPTQRNFREPASPRTTGERRLPYRQNKARAPGSTT